MPRNAAKPTAREARILKRFYDKSIVTRWEAFRAAQSLSGDRVVTALLEALAKTDNWSDREEIVRSLGGIGDRRAIPQVRAVVGDVEVNVRWAAAEALGRLGAQEAAADLIRMLRDEHELVRGSAAHALGRIHHGPAVPALLQALSDEDRFVQHWAAWALGEIDTPEAARALRSEKADLQGAWSWYIRKGERSALPRMRRFLRENYAVQHEAEVAIGSGEPSLVKAAEQWAKDHRTKVRPKREPLKWGQDRAGFTAAPETAPADDWMRKLGASGWLEDVPPTEARRIKAALEKDDQSPEDVLSPAGYDAECIEGSGSYRKWIVSSYEKAAAGQVKFSAVKDVIDSEGETATVSFSIGKRKFSRTFPQPDDYVADGLHAFINRAVAATGEKRRFFEIGTGDQTAALAFVTPAVFARARKLGLV